MPTFTLNTTFDQNSLTLLHATGSNVVVAKPNAGGSPNVAWVVYRPFVNNSMVWEEQYGIYASTSALTNGAHLTQMSATPFPATSGQIYPLLPAGFFGPPQPGGSPNSFTALNQYDNQAPNGPGFLTMGLFQNATVNGSDLTGNAVSAAGVPYLNSAQMTPFTNVYIWTQANVVGNSVVTTVTSVLTKVTFGGPVSEIDLAYDPSSGGFVVMGASIVEDLSTGQLTLTGAGALPTGISIDYVLPALR